jgi:hypothetical protein
MIYAITGADLTDELRQALEMIFSWAALRTNLSKLGASHGL